MNNLPFLQSPLRAILAVVLASFLGGCTGRFGTSTFEYYFSNGTVYIIEHNSVGDVTRYWHDSVGTRLKKRGMIAFNGMRESPPAVLRKVPVGHNPFKWKQDMSDVTKLVQASFADYDAMGPTLVGLGLSADLREGETKEQAFARLVSVVAARYCSYDEQCRVK